MEAKEEKIRVAIRVRPLPSSSSANGNDAACAISCSADGNSVLVYSDANRSSAASFRCGTYLGSATSQADMFHEIGARELVTSALDGFPVTIFAYGQTGAGKSFTIFGKDDSSSSSSSTTRSTGGNRISGSVNESDGILPRAAKTLMEIVDQRRDIVDYTVRVTCVEIYNEQVRDLFDPKKASLAVRHSKDHAFYLENATVVQCKTAHEMIRVVKLAAANRTKSAHLLNERSNRSHCLVTIYIDSMPRDASPGGLGGEGGGGIKKYGKLTIVDLAGSERANDTGAVGQQLKETGHINRSLYCLSNVIQAITANASSKTTKFVPYRDSKLTMLLIDSLGGNSKTLMLACVNAAPQFATESTRTLEFAMGVARIKNRPTAMLNPHEKLICDLKEEIRLLKLENMMLRSRTPGYFTDHPECPDEMDPGFMDEDHQLKTTTFPQQRPQEQLDAMEAIRRRQHRSNNNNAEDATVDYYAHSAGSAMPTGLGGVKKLAMMRRSSTSPKKKKKQLLQKQNKKTLNAKPRVNHPLPPASIGFTLPPVKQQQVALFQKRTIGSMAPAFTGETSSGRNGVSSQVRPNTPPPGYDDLFGIETVAVEMSDHTASVQDLLKRSGSMPATPSQFFKLPATQAVASPSEEIQRLLRDMMVPTKSSSPSMQPQSVKPKASIVASSLGGGRTPQFDDARAMDLFQQLSQL